MRLEGFPGLPGLPWRRSVRVGARHAAGQRGGGTALQDAEERAGEGKGLQNEGGGCARCLQVHRAALQYGPHALGARLRFPRGTRAKKRVKKLIIVLIFPSHPILAGPVWSNYLFAPPPEQGRRQLFSAACLRPLLPDSALVKIRHLHSKRDSPYSRSSRSLSFSVQGMAMMALPTL